MYSNVWVCFDDLSFTIGCWYALRMPGRPHAIQFDQRKWSWSWRPAERKPWVTCGNCSLLSRLYTYGNMVYVIKGSLVEKLPSYGGLTPPHSTHHSHHIAHHTSHITNIASHHITITSHHIIHITDITHLCVTTCSVTSRGRGSTWWRLSVAFRARRSTWWCWSITFPGRGSIWWNFAKGRIFQYKIRLHIFLVGSYTCSTGQYLVVRRKTF